MDPPQASMPSTAPIETTLIPTTDEIAAICPRFRILVVGRAGAGKSSLINAIFKASLADVRHFEAGIANINAEITSPHNKHLVIHDSQGYEPGDEETFRILEKFITERSEREAIGERLHAIWLFVTSPYIGGPIFHAWDEKIFRLTQRKVPIIIVYTKFDLFMANCQRRSKGNAGKGDGSLESAEKYFYEKYNQLFAKSTKNIGGQIPYTIVSKFQPETLRRLVEITMKNMQPPFNSFVYEQDATSDINTLLDFGLWLLQQGGPSNSGIKDERQKTRRLMSKLISGMDRMPRFLSVTDIMIKTDLDTIDMAQFGRILQGEDKGKQVALKVVHKGHNHNSPRKGFYREVLAWRSLTHRFILPLLGIFEKESYMFLVSPLITNGTLIQWRKNQTPIIAEIHRLILEVAEGVQYVHSEGIVHGDLRGENILLDSAFHCQISDIGLTWDSNVTTLSVLNFSAPELFAMCNECHQFDCDGWHSDQAVQRRQTMQTDVYAFGCLLYAIFFDTVPLEDKNPLQIPWLITRRERPARLNSPVMDDGIWNLIEQCWIHNPSERPTMEQIVETYVSFLATLSSLLTTLRELAAGDGSMVNDLTNRLMRKLLEQYKSDTIAFELTTLDVKLFLDFALHLLHDGGLSYSDVQDVNRKARNLMFELIEKRGIMPKSLFITSITTTTNLEAIGLRGEHDDKQVMLQPVYKVHKDDSLRNRFYHEALVWRSLAHQFVLPLLGIFEEDSHLFLASTLMINGTLTEWRKNWKPDLIEIHRMMLKIAEGIQYIHSDEIVHGDLCGENIFIDSSFNCQIANIGLTRHSDKIESLMLNFAAPELFFTGNKYEEADPDEGSDHIIQLGSKTRETDVYSFGCLCYAIFFDTVPFQDLRGSQIPQQVTNGERPVRFDSPPIDDGVWNVIQLCWLQDPSRRPVVKQIVKADMRFTSLRLLLASLSELRVSGSSMVNENTVRLICELLGLPEYEVMHTKLKNESDTELLLHFVVDLLRSKRNLVNGGIQDTNRRARKLMHKLTSLNVMPKFLFIKNVRTKFDPIGMGGYGRVFRGEYNKQSVALKVVDKGRKEGSLRQDFCREALSWRSLAHRSILPLLGIFEDGSQLYLVSPFMTNGTLSEWRKKQTPHVDRLHKLMLEVARGVHYIHSEGIVHGDLHGGNVLLDSDLHCQITDFGSTRHAEATVTRTTTALSLSFAAPELFGVCIKCGQPECDGCYEGHEEHHPGKTTETDVYAFGCLYYAVFFDTVPFHGINDFQIIRVVRSGKRPDRLERPKMEDNTWNLIQNCWETIPSKRPTMEEIVAVSTPLP